MDQNGPQSEPLYVYSTRKRNTISGIALAIFCYGFSAFFLSIGLSPTFIGVLLFALFGSLGLALALYSIFEGSGAEFYEDFLRIVPRRGDPTDTPYSQMSLMWEETQREKRQYIRCPFHLQFERKAKDGTQI